MKAWKLWIAIAALLGAGTVYGLVRGGVIPAERLGLGAWMANPPAAAAPTPEAGQTTNTETTSTTQQREIAATHKPTEKNPEPTPETVQNRSADISAVPGTTITAIATTSTTTSATAAKKPEATPPPNTIPVHFEVVWKANGMPVAEADVRCLAPRSNPEKPGVLADKDLTDQAGRATLHLDRALPFVQMQIKHPEAIGFSNQLKLPAAGPVVVRLDPGYSVFGTVYREWEGKNQPASGAKVTAAYKGAPTATSGKDGKYRLTGLNKGEVDLIATHGWQRTPGSRDERNMVRLKPKGPNGPVDLFMKRALALTGAVLDKETGKPVPHAEVTAFASLNRQEFLEFENSPQDVKINTGEDGTFTINNLPAGPLKLRALAEGYGEVFKQIPIERGKDNTVILEMAGGGSIDVTALDRDGDPVAAAVLNVWREGGHYWAGNTDKEGKFTLNNVKWNVPYTLLVWKFSSYGSDRKEVTLKTGEKRAEVTLRFDFKNGELESKGVIIGSVRDERGRPVAGATVRAQVGWAVADNAHWYIGMTNAAGQYRIEQQATVGDYFMCVNAEGYAPAWTEGVAFGTEDRPRVQDFTLQAAHWISGVVTDGAGKPLGGVVLRALPAGAGIFSGAGHPGMPEQTTGADGAFLMKNLSGPQVLIRAARSGWKLADPGPVAVDRELRLVMRPAGELRGQVVTADSGRPVTEFNVRISGPDLEQGVEPAYDGQGGFRLGDLIDGGTYELRIEAAGYQPLRAPVMATAGNPAVTPHRLAPVQ